MRLLRSAAHSGCMETSYLTYLSQAQSGSLSGPPLEWPRLARRRRPRRGLVRFPHVPQAAFLL